MGQKPFPEIRLKTEKKKTSPPSIISSIKTEGQALGVSPVSSLNSWAMGVCFESSEPVVLVFENQNLWTIITTPITMEKNGIFHHTFLSHWSPFFASSSLNSGLIDILSLFPDHHKRSSLLVTSEGCNNTQTQRERKSSTLSQQTLPAFLINPILTLT